MKVAVIGSGVSGLMAASELYHKGHEIEVFESLNHIGGHVKTIRVPIDETNDEIIPLELGVLMHDPKYIHPQMNAYAKKLGVSIRQFPLTFTFENNEYQIYWTTQSKFSRPMKNVSIFFNSLKNGFLKGSALQNATLMVEIRRFIKNLSRKYAKDPYTTMTLEKFIKQEKYSKCFVNSWLIPQIHCWWGVTCDQVMSTNCQVIFCSIDCVYRVPQYIFTDGWDKFLEKIYTPFRDRIATESKVIKVQKKNNGLEVALKGSSETFDHVIFAVTPNVALELISDLSSEEKSILNLFRTVTTTVYLHRDSDWMPRNNPWSTVNLIKDEKGSYSTFWAGEPHNSKANYFITWGDGLATIPNRSKILTVENWHRTIPTEDYINASRKINSIQGNRGIWYCGAHVFSLDPGAVPSLWHENAFRSGISVAEKIERSNQEIT